MNWMHFIWPMATGGFLTMALVHLWTGLRKPRGRVNVLFSNSALFAAIYSWFELGMTRAVSPADFLARIRWLDLAAGGVAVSLVAFVWDYLGSGRKWFGRIAIGVMLGSLIPDLLPVPKLVFLEITGIRKVQTFGGVTFTVGEGVSSPWNLIFYGGVFLLLAFVADSSFRLWRRGGRRKALVVGGTVVLFYLFGGLQAYLTDIGVLRTPYMVTFCWMAILVVMARELSNDQLRAEQLAGELEENQQRMKLAINAAHLTPWEYDLKQDKIWTTKKGFERMRASGADRNNADGFFLSIHPEDRETTRNAGLRAIETGGEFQVEYRMIDPGGATRWIRASGQVERDAHGTPLRVRGVSMDVTERKHYEAELEFIKRAIDVSPDGAYWMDVAGKFVYVNDVGCASLGYSRDEMLHMSIFDVAPLASAEGWSEVWAFLRDKGEYVTETVHRRKDGSEFPVEISSTYVLIDGHEYVSGFARDITERKLRNQALRESMERYRAMVESFDGFVYICSADNRIEFMNQRMIDWTGRNAVGEPCYRALHDKDSVCEWCVNDKVFQGEIVHWEVQSPKDQRWYYVVNTPIRHADGTVSKQAMIQDITERKMAEQESGQLRLELAHLSRVLTMSELSSSLAHEINQPLGSILNNASTAKILHSRNAGSGGGEVAEILDDIISDTNRAGQIVRKIRGIIKKESVVFEPLDINTLIREVVKLFQNPLARVRISVREELSPDLPPVKGDRVRLQQVVMNLIMNATDAMKGSASRILTVRTAMDGSATVLVSVSDTGSGISETMNERLFTPFATTKKDGLGMGLRICRSILDDHGGSIRAENNAEGGATFAFTLRTDGGGKG